MGGDGIQFRILGPLEVRVDDAPLQIGGPRQRALLGLLLLTANQVVSRDRLIEELLGNGQAGSADHALRVQVSRLRKALGATGGQRLLASRPGYLLRVEPGELDLDVFEHLFAEGCRALEEGDAEKAAAKLRGAEKLWRGRPLADLEFEPFARVEVERLEELRLAAVEARIEAELEVGRDQELVPELEALVREHPLRERLRSQLMLALYRSGRQAEALETYRIGRSLLSQELALEPSPRLRELEQAILRHEPALELAPAEPRAVGVALASPPSPVRQRVEGRGQAPTPGSRRRYVVSGALAAVALAAAAAFFAPRLTSGARARVAAANSVGVIDPRGEAVGSVVDTAGDPRGLAVGEGATWVADAANDQLLQIGRDGAVNRIPVGHGPTGVAVGDGAVWVVNQLDRTVFALNPRTFRRLATLHAGNGADAVAFGHGSLWVANTSDGTVSRIDPETGTASTIPLTGTPLALAVGRGGIWVTTSAGELLLIDDATKRITRAVPIGNRPAGIAVGDGSVWVTNTPEGTVTRFDPGSGKVTKIDVGGAPHGLAYGEGAVWVANSRDGTVERIDPNGNRVRHVRVGNEPTAVAAGNGRVWTTVRAAPTVHRGGTLRVADSAAFSSVGGSVDPAVFGGLGQWQMLSLTNDGLVTYRRSGGIAGATLVPDLATELPSPTGHGRIYTFHLRSGIRYSDGRRVRPEDFRHAIERAFEVGNGYTQSFYSGIVGAEKCARTPRGCSLRRGIVTDDHGNTITFRLTGPDPDFLYKLAFPMADAVPVSTPKHDIGGRPLPATGPYMTESVALTPRPLDREHARGIRNWTLVRNPRFKEWSADAQPRGYPDRIVLDANAQAPRATWAIEKGVDVLLSPAAHELPQLERHSETQLHSDPLAATFAFVMNVRVAPFDRVEVRRALNYAIDRKRILTLAGGSFGAQPTCQILPPTLAGYQPYCPYTALPNDAGGWVAPDLARAERLVKASGTRNARVTVLVPEPGPLSPTTRIGAYVVSVLRRLHFRASLRVLPGPSFDRNLADSRARPQIGWFNWYQDYPAPSNFIGPLLTCHAFSPRDQANLNVAEFCDPGIDTQSSRAAALEARSPGIAGEMWRQIDRRLTSRAVWLPLYNPRATVALSSRVGNYQYHPFWQLLLDQLWVR